MFEKIKYYYSIGLYKDKHLDKLLSVNAITEDEYNEIKGE
jgi:hypothetical protein